MSRERLACAQCSSAPDEAPPSRLEQIRSKALELFAERGFAQVGMRELALHLGIAAGSFYHHFESKENLLFEVIEELYEELLDAAQLTEEGGLQAMLRAHIALHERRRLHFLMAAQEFRCLSPQHQEQIRSLRSRYEDRLLERLREAGATAARPVLQSALQGIVAWLNHLPTWLDRSELSSVQRRDLIDAMVLGALSSLFKPATANIDSATVVPLRIPGACPSH